MYYDSVYHYLTIKKQKELKPFANQIGMIIRYRIIHMFTDIYLLIKSYDS